MNIEKAVLTAGESSENAQLIARLHDAGMRPDAIFDVLDRVKAASDEDSEMGSHDTWVQRPSHTRGTMLRRHRDVFRVLGLEDPIGQRLGSGSFGAAYDVSLLGRSVLKLTRDPYESIASFDLIGKKTRYTVPIFGVWTLEDSFIGNNDEDDDLVPWYVVHRAYLEPLDGQTGEAMNILYTIYHDPSFDMKIPQAHHRGMRQKWEMAIKARIEEKQLNPRVYPRAMLLLDHIGVAVRELHDIGIDWFDFHASNMMKDASGTIRIADVGWGVMHKDTTREIPYFTPEAAQQHLVSLRG